MARILMIARNIPPLFGGMEFLHAAMLERLSAQHRVDWVAPIDTPLRGSGGFAPCTATTSGLPAFMFSAMTAAVRQARLQPPDLILGGGGVTAPIVRAAAWAAARAGGDPHTAVYLHGLDIANRHPVYAALWVPALRRVDRVITNSRFTQSVAASRGIPEGRIRVVPPGLALPEVISRAAARRRMGIAKDAEVIILPGRLTRRKGVLPFVSRVLPALCRTRPNILALVVGDTPYGSLRKDGISRDDVVAAAHAAGVGAAVRTTGALRGREMAEAWASANVHAFPVVDDPVNPEGFGMVAIEAASYGIPTVASRCGGIPDAVADGVSGVLLPPGDDEAMTRALIAQLDAPLPPRPMQAWARQFRWEAFAERMERALAFVV